jgi:hypothetical protein
MPLVHRLLPVLVLPSILLLFQWGCEEAPSDGSGDYCTELCTMAVENCADGSECDASCRDRTENTDAACLDLLLTYVNCAADDPEHSQLCAADDYVLLSPACQPEYEAVTAGCE